MVLVRERLMLSVLDILQILLIDKLRIEQLVLRDIILVFEFLRVFRSFLSGSGSRPGLQPGDGFLPFRLKRRHRLVILSLRGCLLQLSAGPDRAQIFPVVMRVDIALGLRDQPVNLGLVL